VEFSIKVGESWQQGAAGKTGKQLAVCHLQLA